MMGISESTVATQLSLAVKFMREQLMKHYDKNRCASVCLFLLMKCNSNTCFWMGSRMKMYTCK